MIYCMLRTLPSLPLLSIDSCLFSQAHRANYRKKQERLAKETAAGKGGKDKSQ